MKHLAFVILAACGPSATTPPDAAALVDAPRDSTPLMTHVTGMLGGAPFTARDAVWTSARAKGFDFQDSSTVVAVTDFVGECGLQMSSTGTPYGRILVFVLATTDASNHSTPITAAGTYAVFSGTSPASTKAVEVYFELDDASCLKSATEFGASGSVAVTAPSPFAASFDVTFGNGDHITGAVNAAQCAALDPNRTPLGGC